MIVTEEEAKTTRCCGGPNCGKYGPRIDDNMCIGSACMAWRWKGWRDPDRRPDEWFIEKDNAGPNAIAIGFCGKAGG